MIKVEVWSDINCPFCYIGKRHLEAAIQHFSADQVSVEWKSFELDPHANPPKGADNTELLATKYGRDRAWAEEMNRNMTEMARSAGLDFHMDQVIPANSFDAHRLIHLGEAEGVQDQVKEALLSAKFVEGKDISDPDVLRECAESAGVDKVKVDGVVASDTYAEEVRKDEREAAQMGISGVPFFVINRQYALSGAQSVESFMEVFGEVSEKKEATP